MLCIQHGNKAALLEIICEPSCIETDREHVQNKILLLERLAVQEAHIGFFDSSSSATSLVAGAKSAESALEEVGKENLTGINDGKL